MANYLNCTGATNTFASTPDDASFPTGVGCIVDVIAEARATAWTPTTTRAIAAHWQTAAGLRGWRFGHTNIGTTNLAMAVSQDGTAATQYDSGAASLTAGKWFVRAKIDTNTQKIRYYRKALIGDAWTQVGVDDTITVTGVRDTSVSLTVGGDSAGATLFLGRIYRAWFYSGDSDGAGVLVAAPDFSAQALGTTSFVDSTGKTWTLNGSATIEDDGGFVITSPAAYQVRQQDADGNASVTISGTYTGSPTTIEYRVDSGAWATLIASPSGGTFSSSIVLARGTYTISLRFSNDTAITTSIAYVGVDDNIVGAGQSGMSGRATNLQTYARTPTGIHAGLFANSNTWGELVDPWDSTASQVDSVSLDATTPGGSIAPLLARYFIHNRRAPVGFIPCAMGATSITQWLPGADHLDRSTLYGSMNYRIGLAGGAKFVMWWQGETDATAGMSQATYNGHLDTIANALMDDRGITLIPCLLQQLNNGSTAGQQQAIRDATSEAWTDNPNVKVGPDLSDLVSDDTSHLLTDANIAIAAERWWVAIEAAYYSTTLASIRQGIHMGQAGVK